MSRSTFDFELGVSVSGPVKPIGRVRPGHLPAARVARTVYSGPYEGLPAAWGEFNNWVSTNGYEPAENLWEIYLAGPESIPDRANWRTELNRPSRTESHAQHFPKSPAFASASGSLWRH